MNCPVFIEDWEKIIKKRSINQQMALIPAAAAAKSELSLNQRRKKREAKTAPSIGVVLLLKLGMRY